MADYSQNLDGDIEINNEIIIDIDVLAKALFNDQNFIIAVAEAVRNQLLKDARQKGTLFRQWGGTK